MLVVLEILKIGKLKLVFWFVVSLTLIDCALGEKLETVVVAAREAKERIDKERGIFVEIKQLKDDDPNSSFGNVSLEVISESGVEYCVSKHLSDKSERIYKMRLTEETLGYLIESEDEHPFLRFIAVRDLGKSSLSSETQHRLMSLAAKQPSVLVRNMAACAISSLKPKDAYDDLLVKLLNDPCIDVAHYTAHPLTRRFDLKDEKGMPLDLLTGPHTGLTDWFYFRHHQDVLATARALRRVNPKLISLADLEQIEERRVPSDEWFLSNGSAPENLVEAKKRFLETFNQEDEVEDAE